jgi:hypothetical protein
MFHFSDGSDFHLHVSSYYVSMVDPILMDIDHLIPSPSYQISERNSKLSKNKSCKIVNNFNVENSIIQVLNELNELHEEVLRLFINIDL